MNIVRFVGEFNEEIKGGVVPNAYYISKYQVQQGHSVAIFSLTKGRERHKKIDGIDVYWIKRPPFARWVAGLTLLKAVKENGIKPDIVHSLVPTCYGWLFPIAKKYNNYNYCLSVHNSVFPLEKLDIKDWRTKLDSFESASLRRFLARRVDIVLPISEFLMQELATAGVESEKMKVIGPGVDFDVFSKKAIAKKGKKFTILYVGRFIQRKGLQYLIRAIGMLRDKNIKLILIGGSKSDNGYENVINLIKKLDLKGVIEIKEPVPYKKLASIYAEADLFVLPSVLESKGKVVWEAMASKLAVIATNQGGIRDSLESGVDSLLVPIRDERAIAAAIEKLKSDDKLREKLADKGFKKAKEMDWKNIAKAYTKAFEDIVKVEKND